MRIPVCEFGAGGRDESWCYVEKDEKTGQIYYVYKWHSAGYCGPANEGEKIVPLSKAQGELYYGQAVAAAAKHFDFNKSAD